MAERKRIVALFLAILMIVQMLPDNALADIAGFKAYLDEDATYYGVDSTEYTYMVADVDSNGNLVYRELTKQIVIAGENRVDPDIPDVAGYDTIAWGEPDSSNVIKAEYRKLDTVKVTVNYVYSDESVAPVEALICEYEKGTGSALTVTPEVLNGFDMAVTKDGGEVDAITGATVTSKAVTRSVNSAVGFVTGADTTSAATSWGG